MPETLPLGLKEAIAWISGQGGIWIYLIVFSACILENIFPPYPGDTLLFAGAVLASAGVVSTPLVLFLGILGNVMGAMMVYAFGFTRGRKYFLSHQGKFIDPTHLQRIENWFVRYGARIILVSRFLTGIRSAVALAAGLGEVPVAKMLLYTTISTLFWNGLIVGLALALDSNWEAIHDFALLYNRLVLALLCLVAVAWAIQWRLRKNRKAKSGATGERTGGAR
jgi:membrane protein DedA with SNARE-associated domain